MKRLGCVVFAVMLLAACATPYKQARKSTSNGYFDTVMQRGVYDVTFNGNSYTSSKKAHDYALLHAAEVCAKNGYKTFDIVSKTDNSTSSDYFNSVLSMSVNYKQPKINLMVRCSAANNLTYDAVELRDNLKKKYKIK